MKNKKINENKLITNEELKKIQLDIMDDIDYFCKTNSIQYFLMGGTLLGAVRHKGFIPWDDDIDIILFRNDYEKLINNFKSRNGSTEIICKHNRDNYIYFYAKAICNKTILVTNDITPVISVNIDIFPLDNIPEDETKRNRLLKKVKLYKDIMTLKHLDIKAERGLIKNSVIFISHIFFHFISDKKIVDKMDKLFNSFNNESTTYVGNLGGAWGYKEIFRKECFSKNNLGIFEGREYYIPNGYDSILHNLYGDYMKLPPEDKRHTHHGFMAFWK